MLRLECWRKGICVGYPRSHGVLVARGRVGVVKIGLTGGRVKVRGSAEIGWTMCLKSWWLPTLKGRAVSCFPDNTIGNANGIVHSFLLVIFVW